MSSQSNYVVHTLLRARDWQHRPEFDRVCDWWRDGGRGVCALVGMGGAGKTAIADRFLNDVLEGNNQDDHPLRHPNSVFVYSFYDDDKPENFFRDLQFWLEGSSAPDKQKSASQLMFDIQQRQGLMILDGLEKVQESGVRGGFGRLTSPSLRDLLNHIGFGSARELSVLVTSRFPLTELRDSQPRYFHSIPINEIGVPAGIALLRSRCVRGTDEQLTPIVEHCAGHALTIDLAGGYIKEYGHGDPTTQLDLGTVEELQAEAEQEPDDDKRAVLKQGIRFTRIAQRYREAMLDSDEAALALLERICLFRLGVDCETLASIFTGPEAKTVSNNALASLSTDELQRKIAWLVQMRIVEQSDCIRTQKTRYNVHPAVRDGFISGFGREAKLASHQAIRRGLEVSLGGAPGKNVSDAVVLDVLEEIVYHTLAAGYADEAWLIYRQRIGGYKQLGIRLSDFGRYWRILSAFAKPTSPRTVAPCEQLSLSYRAAFYNDYAIILTEQGQLADAAEYYGRQIELRQLEGNREGAAIGYENLAGLYLITGNLSRTINVIIQSQQLLESRDMEGNRNFHATIGQAQGLIGNLVEARAAFDMALKCELMGKDSTDPQLYAFPGIWNAMTLQRLGRLHLATQLTVKNAKLLREMLDSENNQESYCNLLLSDLACAHGELSRAHELRLAGHEWALRCDAREPLCWSLLILARLNIAQVRGRAVDLHQRKQLIVETRVALEEALRIVRDCGYALYHIDLLLERARLNLLQGDPQSALEDIELALDKGIPADQETGQPKLLAANDDECGYAWGIVEGLHLRGEALLLQAAQTFGSGSFGPMERDQLPADVRELITQAEACLTDAMPRWRDLRDPDPREDNNFVHPETGVEYNYKAEETYRVLSDLDKGLLTRCPLEPLHEPTDESEDSAVTNKPAKVFFSYAREDEEYKDKLIKHLSILKRQSVIETWHDRMIAAGEEWKGEIDQNLEDADVILLLVSADFLASDYCWDVEMKRALERHKTGEARVIPVILRSVDWDGAPFAKLQALPKDAQAVNEWSDQDVAFTDVARGIRGAIENPQ